MSVIASWNASHNLTNFPCFVRACVHVRMRVCVDSGRDGGGGGGGLHDVESNGGSDSGSNGARG